MSLPDLDERFDELVLELRATQVAAPAELRERVRALGTPEAERPRRRQLPLRRLALVAVPAAVVLALAGALVGGLVTSGGGRRAAVEQTLAGQVKRAGAAPAPAPRAANLPY